jgi:F-type H+-transporting ATPase subunit b
MRCGRLIGWAAALLLGLAAAAPAWQDHGGQGAAPAAGHADPAHGGAADHKEDAGAKIFAPALDLTLWTIVVFLLLLFILSKYAWGPMIRALEKREHDIHSAAEEARLAREEAHRLREEFQREMAQAQQRARDIVDQAHRNAARAAEEDRSKAKAEIESERERLHREIDLARDQALQQIWSQTAQLATLVSAKAIRRRLTPDDHRALVDEAIAELRQAAAAGGNGKAAGV